MSIKYSNTAIGTGLFVWTGIMLYLLFLPSEYLSQSKIWSYDKLGHAVLFGVWVILYWMFRISGNATPSGLLLEAMAISLSFGGVVEILQYILPINRGAEILDFVADAVGIVLGLSVCKLFYLPPNKKRLY